MFRSAPNPPAPPFSCPSSSQSSRLRGPMGLIRKSACLFNDDGPFQNSHSLIQTAEQHLKCTPSTHTHTPHVPISWKQDGGGDTAQSNKSWRFGAARRSGPRFILQRPPLSRSASRGSLAFCLSERKQQLLLSRDFLTPGA